MCLSGESWLAAARPPGHRLPTRQDHLLPPPRTAASPPLRSGGFLWRPQPQGGGLCLSSKKHLHNQSGGGELCLSVCLSVQLPVKLSEVRGHG